MPPPSGRSDHPVHLVIPTHTTRHLERCLARIACQTAPPASVTVSTDGDAPDLAACIEQAWSRVGSHLAERSLTPPPLVHVSRPHAGEARLNQVRNNALRALDERVGPDDADLVLIIDGDMLLADDAIERHARLASAGADVVIAHRVNLTEQQTDSLFEHDPFAPLPISLATAEQLATLSRRARRDRRHLAMKRFGLVKPHKPKLLGGHHAVRVRAMRQINGYDEQFVGYGYDDDDLARRLHALRPRLRDAVATDTILAFHLWHPTRAPASPTDAPGYTRFLDWNGHASTPVGWDRPADQPTPSVRVIEPRAASAPAPASG